MTNVKRRTRLTLLAMLLAWGVPAYAQGYLASQEPLAQIRPGTTTAQQVRDLLGAPARTLSFPARGIQALEYDARDFGRRIVVSIAVGNDGIVRDITRIQQSGP